MAHPRPTTPQAPTASTAPSRLRPGRGAARTGAPRRASQGAGLTSLQQKPWWPWLTRGLAGAFFVLVASLIAHQARSVHWPAVWQAVLALPARVLWAGAALRLTRNPNDARDLVQECITKGEQSAGYREFCGMAPGLPIVPDSVRYRLYSRRGVEPGTIAQVVATSILTNWIGYLLLAAAIPWLWVPPAVFGWSASAAQWRMGGALLALAPLAYLALCLVREGRPLALRGHRFALPRWPLALWQVVVSCANWMLMGAALWVVLQGQVAYPAAIATVMLGAVAGLVLRVPAGLGVLELVGVALLTMDTLSKTALLAYRALYYFVPLVLAALALATAELLLHGKKPTK